MPNLGSRTWLVMITGALIGSGYKGAKSALEVAFVLGSASVALGQDSTVLCMSGEELVKSTCSGHSPRFSEGGIQIHKNLHNQDFHELHSDSPALLIFPHF